MFLCIGEIWIFPWAQNEHEYTQIKNKWTWVCLYKEIVLWLFCFFSLRHLLFFVNFITQLSHIVLGVTNISNSNTCHDQILLSLLVTLQPPLFIFWFFSLIFQRLFSLQYLPWFRLQSMGDCNENFEKENSKGLSE